MTVPTPTTPARPTPALDPFADPETAPYPWAGPTGPWTVDVVLTALAHPVELDRLMRHGAYDDPRTNAPGAFVHPDLTRAIDTLYLRYGQRADGFIRRFWRAWAATAKAQQQRAMTEAPWPVILAAWQRLATMPTPVRTALVTDFAAARQWLGVLRSRIAAGTVPLETLVADVMTVRFHRAWWSGAADALPATSPQWFVAGDPILPILEILLRAPDPAQPKRLQQAQQFVRQQMATAVAKAERYSGAAAQEATALLDRTVRAPEAAGTPSASPVLWTPEEVAALPWLHGPGRVSRGPTAAEIDEAVQRTIVPAYRRQVRGSRTYPYAVLLETLLALPQSAAAGLALWARATTSSQRLALLLHGKMSEGGPWWREVTWRAEAVAAIADPAVTTDLESVNDRLLPILRTTVGEGSADVWLRALLRCVPTVLRVGSAPIHRGWLALCLTHPTWRPTPTGLLPLLQCEDAEIRIAAHHVLAVHDAGASPTRDRDPVAPAR